MSMSKIESIRNLSREQIEDKIIEIKKEMFALRMQKATKQLEKTHLFKHTRRELAQLLTVETEQKNS
uniref:ribosomal protein L29 n=1 Tax=Madagascaria erythrocladioides TaxID=753684 RepID=UPI001BEE8079|nr:ribosomal protein L29 [Madagascaria erythrocladioides]QUE29024.1 ribosomal protein L29 [Madagascaria erythrocladioides]UNJ16578.1 ribosomal protein L29 [Madagascaria erythrocladioides]